MSKNQKPYTLFYLLCALTIGIVASVGTASAQSSEPKTVADFMLLVPDRYVDGYDRTFREELLRGEHRGTTIDIPNGYILYDESDNPSGFEFAIFKKSNGKYLVAYSTGVFNDPELNKELGNWPVLYLLSYERGRWRDVRRSVLPVPFDKKLAYLLPRQGRSIAVIDASGRKLYDLTWKNDRFHFSR
jgi:hypothetical protein